MALTSDITLNASAFTGVSAASAAAEISRGPGFQSLRGVTALANTTPKMLDIQHTEVKRGRAKYYRSTIGLVKSNIAVPEANPEGVISYQFGWRLVLERPVLNGVVTEAEICTQLGELLSVFGASLSVGGVPTTNVHKFLARES